MATSGAFHRLELVTRERQSSCTSSVPGVNQDVLASANPCLSASPVATVGTWNLDPACWEKIDGQVRKYWIKWGLKSSRTKMRMWQDNGCWIPFQKDLFFLFWMKIVW